MEIKNTEKLLENDNVEMIETDKEQSNFNKLLDEKNTFNDNQIKKHLEVRFIRPNTMIELKFFDYDSNLKDITFIVPDTKTRLEIQKNLTVLTAEQDIKTNFVDFFLMLENKRLLRYSGTNKAVSINDLPMSQVLELGGCLIQFIIQ